ncbi:hypothetical protein [Yersinia phage vB_YenM_P778]
MAYMNKELKARLVAEVKKVLPKGWKVTYRVENYSSINLTIRQAPIRLEDIYDEVQKNGYVTINHFYIEKHVKDTAIRDVLVAIYKALDSENYNNSDIQTDYFDVGYYINMSFGAWDKPFISTAQ